MKIIFLCGSLEPGKDGVGDYTLRLASELVIHGHQCAIIALMDKFINIKIEENGDENKLVKLIRLPFKNGYKINIKEAGQWIEIYNPEWISLQYVPFAFSSKGLPFRMGNMLNRFGSGRNWHIMFHELWVGMDKEAKLKYIFWGWIQRQLISSLFFKIKPTVIHTQSKIYMRMLEKIGIKPQYLPLFGNVTIASKGHEGIEEYKKDNNSKTISFVIFGGIHHGAPIGQLAEELKLYTQNTGINVILKLVGRCGSEQQHWEKTCIATGIQLESLGEQSQERISEILNNSSFGISTTPASLIEKSGSVAAMREHGLPILCVSRSWHPRWEEEISLPTGVTEYKQGEIYEFISNNKKTIPINNISGISHKFVNTLLLSVKHGEF